MFSVIILYYIIFTSQSSSRVPSQRIFAESFQKLRKGSAPAIHSDSLCGSQGSQFPDQTSHYDAADHLCDVWDVQLDQFSEVVPKVLQLSELSQPRTPDTLARE